MYDDAVKNKMFWNATPSFQEFQRRLQNPKYVQTVQANYRAHGRSGDAFDTLSGFRDYFCVSDEDKQDMTQGVGNMIANTKARLAGQQRYNKLKQYQDKQRGGYGRLDLGVKNPLTNDNVVREPLTGRYLTSDGAEYAQEYEAVRAQNHIDETGKRYTEAVERGDLPSAFEVRDKDGNYALMEDLGVKPGVHVTEKGKQQQLAGLVNTRKNVEEQYNALYRKLEEDFKRSAPFSINTHSQYGIDDNNMRLQAYLNSNAQYRRLKAQLHQLDNAIGVGKEAVKGRAEERYVKNAKGMLGYAYRDLKSFGASALRGLWNAVSDVSTWDLGLQDLQDNMTLYTTVKKARQKGYKNLNSEERQMLDVAAKTGAYTAENQQYLGRGYKAGNVTGESLPFMVEMALNPASGLGEAALSKYMRNAIAKYGKEAVRKEAWKYVTKKCGYRVAGDVLGAALMTGTTGSARTLADTYDRLTGDIKSTYDSNGKIVYDGTENEEKGILKAYLKAFGATAIENHSEFVGEYFNPLLKGVGTLTMKGWKKVNAKSANAFLDNLKDMGSTSTAKWLGNLFDKTQWHDTIGEYAEEVVGNIENALLVGDSTLDAKEGTGVFNLDQNIDTFLGVSLMGGFFSTLKTGAYVRDKVKGERKILMQQSLDLDNSIRYALGADPRLADKWKEWRVALAQGTDEEKKQALKEISENTNGYIKKAMYDYSANAQKIAGMDKATQGAVEDGTITPEQAQRDADIEQAHEEGLAAEGTARHDIQQEHQLRENSLARMLGISAEQLDRMEDEDIEAMTGQNDALDTAIYDYQTSRERYQGVIDRATDEVEQAGIDAAHQIDLYTDHSTGQIRPCVIKGNNGKEDYQGYIVNGNIATHPDGAIDVSGSDKMILYFDPETGKIEHGDASAFASLGESADATVARQQAIDEAKQQAAQAQSRDIDGGVGEDGNVSEAMPTFPQSSDQEERNAANFDIGQVVNAETGEVIPVSFEGLAEGENAYLTGGRPDGKAKDRLKVTIVDADGNVTNRVMKRGNVQMDGRMSAEDFRNAYEEAVSSRMAPEADMNGQENNVDEEGVVAGGAAPSADKAATSEEEGAASEPAVRDKNGNPIYDKMPISATIADLYDGALDDAEIDGFVSAQIAEAEKAVEKMEKKKPKVGTDKAKYLADKKAWEEGLQEAQRKVQYWQDVKAEVEKITTPEDARGYEEELNGDAAQTAYRNGSDAAAYGAREVTAEFMQSGDVKITPESYRKETGFGAAEQRAMVGKISKGGKSIDRLAEDLEVFDRENYNGMYFGGDSSVAKDAILDYLSSPDSRKGVKKMQSEAEREYVEAYEAERDRYYQEKYHMSYEEYLVYSSQEMPELLRKYSNFDEQLFLERYADEIEAALQKREEQLKQEENGKEGNVSAGEESGHGRGYQVQSGERTDDTGRGEVGKDSAGEVGPRHEGVVESEAASKESLVDTSKEITPEQQSLLSRPNSSQYTAERESSDHKDTNNTDTKQGNEEKSAKALSNKQSSGQAKMSHKEKTGEKEAMSPTPAMIDRMIEEQRVDDVSELLISSELKKAAEGIAEAFGMKVVYLKKVFIKSDDPAVEDFEGNGFVRNGVIYLSLKEANIAQFTFGHELLHQLKQIDADSYMRIRQKVIAVMGRKAFEMEVKARQMTYANVSGYTLFEDYAEEVIADTLGDIITHTDMLPNIARSLKENPSLLDRFLNVVDNVRQYFRGKIGGALGDLVNDIRDTYEMTAQQGAERDKFSLRLAEAKNNTDKNPSQAQKESGNYRKGHIRFGGYNYTIENPQGSYRSGVDENGKKWKQKMNNTYGYILGTKGKDGDHLDMFINDKADLDSWNGDVYVVDQVLPDGSFDEHKVMYGFDSEEEARKAYLSNYEQGWQGLGNITGVSKEDFDRWLEKSGRKTKAFSEYKNMKPESAESPKTGAFGTVYTQFRGKAQEAIAFLLEKKEGEAVGALHHKDIGDIDLVWGKEGTAKSDGFGLAKLAKYHPEVLGNLQEILDAMVVVKRTDNRVQLESETHQASVRLTWDSEKKNWLLTAFEKKNSVSDNTTDTVGTAEGGKRNDTATPQNTVSDGKDTEKVSSGQENEEKKASGDRPLYASLGVSRSLGEDAAEGEPRWASWSLSEPLGEDAAEGEREATSVRLQKADIVDAEAMAEEYGLDADDVRRYAEGMLSGNLALANQAFASIRVAKRRSMVRTKLSEFAKIFSPIEKKLYERFGNIDELREEYVRRVEEERSMMEAARKRAEEEQRKREVRLEELAVLTDEEIDHSYAEALAKGDVAAAREMLDEAARRKGYGDVRSDYQGVGAWRAPSKPDYETDEARRNAVDKDSPNLNVEDMAAGYSNQPEDIFVHPNKYSQGLPTSKESGNAIQTAIDDIRNGKKDVTVKVYRAVPTSVKEGKLRNGDWVTPSRKYAELHGSSRLEGKYRIIEDEVPVSELWWDGNDVNEWGYDNGKGYRYKNVKNNRKLNDLVTRDDNGNVIPPSKRFNQRKADERYQRGVDGVKPSKAEAVLRDAVIDRLRENGMEVITDVAEGQKVLDEANGDVREMSFGEPYDYEAYPLGRVEPNLADREVMVVMADADHGFMNYKEAKAWAKQHVAKVYNNEETGGKGDVRISNAAIDKFMSQSAVDKSDDKDVHMSVLKVLPEVLKNSIDVETHPDFLKGADGKRRPENGMNKDVLVHRCYGAVSIDGKPYRVKITLKENVKTRETTHTHSYEATKIELLAGQHGDVTMTSPRNSNSSKQVEEFAGTWENQEGPSPNTNNSISAAKLLENVVMSYNPGEKVLDASEKRSAGLREQRVYHGSGADFEAFDHGHMGEGQGSQVFGWGTYVTSSKAIGESYAESSSRTGGMEYTGDALTADEASLVGSLFISGMSSYHEVEEFLEKSANSDKPGAKRSAKVLALLRKTKPEDWRIPEMGKRQLYTVEIPEDNGSNYLDWENPLNDAQKEILKEGLMAAGVNVEFFKGFGFTLDSSFKYVYSASLPMMLRGVHVGKADNVKEKVSRFLSGLGFTGIKYPAGTIHGGAEKGDMNYVIFNEKDAKITDHVRFFRTANGEAYGFTVGGKIYVDPRIATSETPVHEYAHLWASALRSGNVEEWQNVVGLMKDSKVWDEVKGRYPELKTDDEIADEVIATYSGRRGAERLREEQRKIAEGDGGVFEKAEAISALEKVKRALKMFWKGVADFLHIHYKSAEEVADRVMKDLLEGVDPRMMGDGVDRQRYASLGVSRPLGEDAAEGGPRYASSGLSEQQLDGDDTIRFSLRQEPAPKVTKKGYAVFIYKKLKNGGYKLVPKMLSNDPGAPAQTWLNADTGYMKRDENGEPLQNTNGRASVSVNGSQAGGNKSNKLAWRPGKHLAMYPNASQFKSPDGTIPKDVIFFEVEYAADPDLHKQYQRNAWELGMNDNGQYRNNQGGLPYIPKDSYYLYRTNSISEGATPMIITGAYKINRALTDAEAKELNQNAGGMWCPRKGGDLTEEKLKDMGLDDKGLKKMTESFDMDTIKESHDESDEARLLPGYKSREINWEDKDLIHSIEENGQDINDYRDGYVAPEHSEEPTIRFSLDKDKGTVVFPSKPSKAEAVLRDAVIDRLRENGMEVITDVAEGQKVLDEANGDGKLQMGDAPETFAERLKLAVENRGVVMPGLNETYVEVVKDIPRHGYTGTIAEATREAIDAAKRKYAGKELTYNNYGVNFNYTISANAIEICLSPKHQNLSANKGIHLALAEHLEEVINNSIEVEEHPDYIKNNGTRGNNGSVNTEALMHRFYGVAVIDGTPFRIMTLMREGKDSATSNGIHSYAVQKIEVLDNDLPSTSNGVGSIPQVKSGSLYPLAKLLKGVEKAYDKGKYLLEESKKRSAGLREQRIGGADGLRFFRTANGEAYGFTVGGKIYVDPRIATSETPVHEYAHLWASALRSGNVEEWQNVVGLMKDSKVWDEVKGRYPELKTDDEIADEVIATYSGRRGAERLREEQRKIAEGDGGVFEKAEAISALEKVKRALKMFWKGVADFLHIHYKSAEEVADRVMKDLLEGVDPRMMGDGVDRQRYASLGVSRPLGEREDMVRYQFIGEKGAAEADHAEEVSVRLDNLSVAREMEAEKKDAKAIKMATGWERGADGKWRYEIPDSKLNDMMDVDGKGKMVKRHEEDMLWTSGKLGNVVDAPELFKAYPELKNVRLETDTIMNDLPSNGEFSQNTNTITIHADNLKYLNSILNHEIQHAIQHIEGFANGGSSRNVRRRIQNIIDEERDASDYAKSKLKDWVNLKIAADKLDYLYKNYINSDNGLLKNKAIEAYWDAMNEIDNHPASRMENNYPEGSAREIAESGYHVDEVKKELRRLSQEAYDAIPEGNMDALHLVRKLENALEYKSNEELYHSLGGEVEARNVQERMGMSAEERRASLAAETEDVAREDQIFLMGHGVSNQQTLRNVNNQSLFDAIHTLYSKGKAFAEKIYKRKFFDVAETPDFMKRLGLTGDKFTIRYGVISRHFGKDNQHDFTEEEWKQIPKALSNPILITEYYQDEQQKRQKGYRIYTPLKLADGSYVVVSAEVKNAGKNLEINAINTIFGRNAISDIHDRIVYQNPKITPEQMSLLGKNNPHQYPSDQELSDANVDNSSETAKESEGKDRQRWASWSLSEQQLDGDDTIRFSLNYDKWNSEMASWLKRNRLPKNAQRPVVPQREAGESDLHFAGRLAKYNQDKALWNTAPKYEGHLSSGMTARGEFNYELQRGSVLTRIAVQDSMLAIRKAQEAIARHSGLLKVGTFEDAYMAENNSHGKAKNEFEQYDQEYLEPLRKWFNVMMKRLDGSYNNVTNYMIAKHGLERNAHMAFMAALEAEAKKAIGNTQPDAKRLRAQMIHDAYRQYKADSRRLINDADYEAGKYDYAQWRRTDDAIRKSYCSNYESFRYDKGGVVRDYSGLSSLFLNETDFEEKAAELCADIESKNGHETSELWDAVRQATRQILKNSHDAGMMSDETYDYVRGMYEHYIPLRGWNDSAADEVWDYAGGGRGVFNAALKEAHGRQSLADDPVAYIMNMAESGFLVNNRNWVKQHFLTMAMNHPTDLLTVSKAWYVKTKDQFGNEVWIPASPNIPVDETDPAVIEAALNAFQTKMEQMEQSGDATQQRGSLNIEYPQTKSEEREHEVRVMKDGEEYVIYVNGDPQLAQALNNTRAMRVREHEGNFEKACAWLGRKMAAVYTSLSPLFVPSNWARDTTMTLASTAIREDARYNWLLRTKFMRPDVQMRMFGLVKEYQNGKLREKVKSRTATKTEENFWNFMINGGETGFVSTMDVDAFREKIQRDLKDMGRTRLNPVKVGHAIADSVEYINRVIEDSNRFAIYQTSIEYGRGIEEAVQDAKNVTLNFNRKGTGEMGMSAIRQLYLFINPAIQSLQTLGALAKEHKAKFTAVTSAWMASGMLVPLFNELMFNLASAAAGGGGDDDDEFNPKDEYWKFSSFDRRNNCILWIPFTHNFIKIPLAPEFRGFYGIGDMVASAMWGGENAKESWSNYAADLMGQIIDLSPLDPVSYDGNVLVSLMPNAIRPLVEIAQNVTFTGKPIYRESDFNKYDPSFKKAYAGTPDFLLRYSKWMNSIGNKYPEAQQGPVEQTAVGRYANNPAVIDHLLKSYLGGMYTLGSQIAGAITKASDEETRKDFKTADIPFFSKFVANPNDRPQSKNKGDAYWQDFEKYQRTSHTLGVIRQDARKTGNFSVLEDFYKSEEYKEMKEYEPKAKQRKEEQKYEKWKEEGNADLYQPHQQTGEDVYKRHSTPADDFEDTKASILYQKIKPAKDIFDLADVNTPSGMDIFNKYYDLAGKVEEAHSVKKKMNAIVKSFVNDEHKATFDPEKMKEYRALRKQYVQLVEEGNRMFEKIKAQRN